MGIQHVHAHVHVHGDLQAIHYSMCTLNERKVALQLGKINC